MNFQITASVPAPLARVWEVLMHPEQIAVLMSDCHEVKTVEDGVYQSILKTRVAYINATFKLETRVVEKTASSYLKIVNTGTSVGLLGMLKQEITLQLNSSTENKTEIKVSSEFTVTGIFASLGQRIIRTKAEEIATQWTAALVQLATEQSA